MQAGVSSSRDTVTLGESTKADVIAALGETLVISFESAGLNEMRLKEYLVVHGRARITEGGVFYPITPSTSVAEKFESYAAKYRTDPETGERKYAVVQAEDELAAIGVVIGAAWNGARSFTATSGPGFSLKQEAIGLAHMAELPLVICNVQRCGPSTGIPTRTVIAALDWSDLLTEIVSGDRGTAVYALARAVRVSDVAAELHPADKVARVTALAEAGCRVVVYDIMYYGAEGLPADPRLEVVAGDLGGGGGAHRAASFLTACRATTTTASSMTNVRTYGTQLRLPVIAGEREEMGFSGLVEAL